MCNVPPRGFFPRWSIAHAARASASSEKAEDLDHGPSWKIQQDRREGALVSSEPPPLSPRAVESFSADLVSPVRLRLDILIVS